MDIKSENFMVAHTAHNRTKAKGKGKGSKSLTVANELAGKLRLLDLGLLTPRKSMGGHRPDEGVSEIVGTPLYASRNIHENHTPSRRDDLEALGFVIAELVIRLVAEANGESNKFDGKGDSIPTYLPWSCEPSDDAIGAKKAKEVKNHKSLFYKLMGDAATAAALHKYFSMTESMKYEETPDYGIFSELLGSLSVTVKKAKKKAATKSPTRPRSTRVTRSKRTASAEESDEEDEKPSPPKQQKTCKGEDDEDAAMEIDDDDEVLVDVYEDAAETEDMEWETAKENQRKPDSPLGVEIAAVEGPHAGEHFDLTVGDTEAVVLGKLKKSLGASKPGTTEAFWPLRDSNIVGNHARLDLACSRRQALSVKVTDLKSKGGILIGSNKVGRGETRQIFINDTFQIGETVFAVKPLAKSQAASEGTKPKVLKSKAPAKKKPLAAIATDLEADVILRVVSGPHEGESISLFENGTQVINLGSKAFSAKKGEPVVLDSDPGIDELHARIQLRGSKKMVSVAVTDLSESGTLVNGKRITKGKEHIAFANDQLKIGETTIAVLRG